MSDQSDALNKIVREKGVSVSGPNPPLPGMENDADRPDLPHVKYPDGWGRVLDDFAREVGQVIGANGLYRREAVPVTIDPETGRIEDMGPQRLRTYVDRQVFCYDEISVGKKAGTREARRTMQVDEARGVLESDSFRYPLRKLRRVHFVRLPVMRRDGRIELLPKGYDAESEILTMKDCLEYDTEWSLERARLFLQTFLAEFPFENERSKAVHLCAMLSVFGSALLERGSKPMNFCYRANKERSGKGLAIKSVIVGPCGPFVDVQAISDSKEEFRKVLDTEALNGSPYIFLDEVENRLQNRTLNAFITGTKWSGRLMNSQKKFSVDQQAIVFIAGNNIELSGDLTGRFLLVDFYVAEADPQQRVIKHVIDDAYLARDQVRADFLSAAWAILNAWNQGVGCECDEKGNVLRMIKRDPRPAPTSVYRGFETFSRWFGGMIENAGYGNPMESTASQVNPVYASMQVIVEELANGVEKRAEYEFHELIDVCRKNNLFEWHMDGKVVKVGVQEKDSEGNVIGGGTEERFDLTPSKKSWFGKLFSKVYGGSVFTLLDGRRVQFGKHGENRQRRYTIEILNAA